jgi:hypothetical protein
MGRRARERSEEEREEVLDRVFDVMCAGGTVEEASREVGVKAATVRQWVVRGSVGVRERYWEARKMLGSALAEEALRVARETTNATAVADKLLVDTLRWAAGKANPGEYGEKQVVEHQGTQRLEVVVREEEKPMRQIQATAVMGVLGQGAVVEAVIDGGGDAHG